MLIENVGIVLEKLEALTDNVGMFKANGGRFIENMETFKENVVMFKVREGAHFRVNPKSGNERCPLLFKSTTAMCLG